MDLELHQKTKNIQPNQTTNIAQGTLNTVKGSISTLEDQRPQFKSVSRNRKKKEKLRIKRQQAREGLQEIIKNMYGLKTDFKKSSVKINDLLEIDLDEDRFYQFINKIMREQVDVEFDIIKGLANSIHIHTQNFCKFYRDDQAISATQIAQLYELVDIVKQASLEVQKMINWFILKVEEVGNEEYFHRNLDLSTLKYIFKLDPFKEDFEHFCCAFIRETKDKKQKILIESILKSFKDAEQFVEISDENDDFECYQEYDDQSTLSYEDPKKKKKKRNKRKQGQQMKEIVQEIQIANFVVRNLQDFGFNEAIRASCYVDQEWLDQFRKKNMERMENKRSQVQLSMGNEGKINDFHTNQ